jgi:putative ABC transport system ATP-binding protein
MRDSIISARRIGKSYGTSPNTISVLKDLTFDLRAGELSLYVGPSGSGKSTLLACLSGLVRPNTGEISVLGRNLWDLSESARDRFRLEMCGFVFQGFNLFPALTALENVALPLGYLGISTASARCRAMTALTEVGLSGREHLLPNALSGGEQQRTSIARATAKRPAIIFADEPTSALDAQNGQIVIDLLRFFAHQHGAAVIGVTHDARLLGYADRVLALEDGMIVSDKVCANASMKSFT